MTNPIYPFVRLSKGSILLLHLVRAGHVWRGDGGLWMASTERNKRNVHLRVMNLERRGLIVTRFDRSFPELTDLGRQCLNDNPVENVLEAFIK